MIVRGIFLVLVFANLLFFAWARGYFGGEKPGHEPQRLDQQLQPNKLRIVRDNAQPVAVSAGEPACRMIDGLDVADADQLKKTVEGLGWQVQVTPKPEPPTYLVLIPELPGKAAAERKSLELNRLGVKEFKIMALNGERYEIIFDSFAGESGARNLLTALNERGIRSARLESRAGEVRRVALELRGPAPALEQQLPGLIGGTANVVVAACPAPPAGAATAVPATPPPAATAAPAMPASPAAVAPAPVAAAPVSVPAAAATPTTAPRPVEAAPR